MNADQLPLYQPVVVTDTPDFRATATRINSEWVELVYNDQRTNDATLKILGRVDGTSSEIVLLDKLYWNVTVNDRPATELDLEDLIRKKGLSISVNPSTRVISVTVR